MKLPQVLRSLLIVICILLFSSCVSRKEIVYFQGLERAGEIIDQNRNNGLEIKPNDLLTISVSAPEIEAAIPFNLPVTAGGNSFGGDEMRVAGTPALQSYLVDSDGEIEFPVLGTINVQGLSRQQLAAKLKNEIAEYVQEPIVNVRIINFQVSVLGEVNRPGTFDIRDENLSLPKALGLAGDLSIYGKRNNVLVMREDGDKKVYEYLDLTDPQSISSPFYYLQQNDVVYVEPNGAQRQSASYNRNAGVYISIASVLISLVVLITK
ncbi:polysaccharide biosynthesis/export family protein [Christiangramia echinicola]|uniref:Polysaccharide export outer membrane protein n=1 Tax=Christiangramia echinicola TaxID=279359 RepID=A0A1H1LU05_9FLAO|nr:polysaccharide biosynthesis/export family protein [Christiangramia echinicola]SDR77840.1 polysaccharide export outer membrane protein [Christiangramia echinicola]